MVQRIYAFMSYFSTADSVARGCRHTWGKVNRGCTKFFKLQPTQLKKGVALCSATSASRTIPVCQLRATTLKAASSNSGLGGAWKFFVQFPATTTRHLLRAKSLFSGNATLVWGIYSAATGEV